MFVSFSDVNIFIVVISVMSLSMELGKDVFGGFEEFILVGFYIFGRWSSLFFFLCNISFVL